MNEPTDDERMDEGLHRCRCQHCDCKRMVRGADLLCRWCRDDDHDDPSGEWEEGEV
jgi:hypothetical protein